MIYTIGYQRLTPKRLGEFVDALDAVLIDCRTNPISRIPGFGHNQLEWQFGMRYAYRGRMLGGRGNTTPEGIDYLREMATHGNALLLCLEEAPGDCHRHHNICGPHFPDAVHIFRDELFTAGALQAALDAGPDADYEICGKVDDLANQPNRCRICTGSQVNALASPRDREMVPGVCRGYPRG
jgi:hypothetical protein